MKAASQDEVFDRFVTQSPKVMELGASTAFVTVPNVNAVLIHICLCPSLRCLVCSAAKTWQPLWISVGMTDRFRSVRNRRRLLRKINFLPRGRQLFFLLLPPGGTTDLPENRQRKVTATCQGVV